MAKVEANISMSLDGFVAGPNLEEYPGLGEAGQLLHAWVEETGYGLRRRRGAPNRRVGHPAGAGGPDWLAKLFLHVAPAILNSGTRLFEHLGAPIQLERVEVMESRHATHPR